MTTLTDTRPDVRTSGAHAEADQHRRPRRNVLVAATALRSPWWLVAMTGGTVTLLLALGTVSYTVPQIV